MPVCGFQKGPASSRQLRSRLYKRELQKAISPTVYLSAAKLHVCRNEAVFILCYTI